MKKIMCPPNVFGIVTKVNIDSPGMYNIDEPLMEVHNETNGKIIDL